MVAGSPAGGGPSAQATLPVVGAVALKTPLDLGRALRHLDQEFTTTYTAWQHRSKFQTQGNNLLDVFGSRLSFSAARDKLGHHIIPLSAGYMRDVRWDMFIISVMAVPPAQ